MCFKSPYRSRIHCDPRLVAALPWSDPHFVAPVTLCAALLTMVTFFTSFLLEFPSLGLPSAVGTACRYVFMLFPNYALSKGFADLGLHGVCPVNVDCVLPSAFSWDIVGQKLVFLLLSIPVYFALLMFVEYRISPVGTKDKFTDLSTLVEGGRGFSLCFRIFVLPVAS